MNLLRQCLLCLAGLLPLAGLAEVFLAQVSHVPDGDTLVVRPDDGGAWRTLRLLGLDAPEICQPGGEAARAALQQKVADKLLLVEVRFQDSYGRELARVRVDGQDLGAMLVASGHAWSSRWRRSPGPYARQEAQARAAGLGLFADAQAELPRVFRQRHGSCYPER